MKKMYCRVVIDDFSRFSWVFFLATKDETSGILKPFITGIENQINHRVKIIRCDNGTEFKNKEMNQFCEMKGIKREFSVARTPQQNRVAERKNITLIEAARTMLADSKLPTTFWAETINTTCYVQNRVLVIKPHNKTPYELFNDRPPIISFMRPFGCPITILSTLDHLGKFDGKADKGFFVGYSVNTKAFRVFNSRTRIVEETLYITFLENKPNVAGRGPEWLFDIDTLTKSMNYNSVVVGNQTNGNACTKESIDAGQARKKTVPSHEYILLPLWTPDSPISSSPKRSDDEVADDAGKKSTKNPANEGDKDDQDLRDEFEKEFESTARTKDDDDEPMMPNLEDIGILVIEDLHSAPQTRRMTKNSEEHIEPKKVIQALIDPSWIEAMQNELLQNKNDERGILVRNKARLVAQGYTQEEGIYYDEVFALVVRIEAIRLFLADASFRNFVVYQMDVKSEFLYSKIEEEVYVYQPPGFEDPEFPDRVYKVKGDILLVQVYVDDIIFGSTKKELCTEFEKFMHKKFQMSSMTSRPDIMFVVCACARFQVTPKVLHPHPVKRIFRYLKGQPKLGLWYPKDSPFDLEAYTDSDYASASLDRKSTTGASCCGQVLWIQNQMLDYGYNFMNTKIFIDNESTICIAKNPIFHSKTKHIEIRHHFIKDSNEKKLIQMIKIYTYQNVVDLLTKVVDVSRFQYLIASIGMLNL
ncbi:putative ribonuclease H-like domain-containing protein [Tanacetum coccineum]